LQLTARSIVADLLADYGQPQSDFNFLKDDGTIAYELLDADDQKHLLNWMRQSGMIT
jgi:hypothetical protein